jgi:hypothetical protein
MISEIGSRRYDLGDRISAYALAISGRSDANAGPSEASSEAAAAAAARSAERLDELHLTRVNSSERGAKSTRRV